MYLWLPDKKSNQRKQRKDDAARLAFSEETKRLPEDARKEKRAEWVRPSKRVQEMPPGIPKQK